MGAVECEDPAGNTDTISENYEVKAFEVTANDTATTAHKTQNTEYQISVETKEMTDNVETDLTNTQVNTETYDLSVPSKPDAVAIHLSHYTQWHSGDFRHDFIPEH